MIIKHKIALASLSSAFLLSACVSLLPDPTPAKAIYRLSHDASTSYQKSDQPIAVRIDRPKAPQALRGTDLIASPDGNRITIINNAEWAESLPNQVQSSFVATMNARPDLVAVVPTSGARTDYRAHVTIETFEANFDQGEKSAPLVKIEYYVTLAHAGNRNLIGTANFADSQRASSIRVSDIVAAKSELNTRVMSDISEWVAESLSAKTAF